MTPIERQFLIETLTGREALDKLYKSTTFAKIEDPQTGLYCQGTAKVSSAIWSENALGTLKFWGIASIFIRKVHSVT